MDSDLRPSASPRKVKFAPKGPPRREAKPPEAKREVADGGDTDDEISEALLRKVNDHLTRRSHKAEKKSSVQVAFAHGVASSSSIRTYGVRKEGTGGITSGKGLRDSTSDDGQDLLSLPSTDRTGGIVEISENAMDPLSKKKKRQYKEPWDYHHSYYPTTLPLRRPFPGDPVFLDDDEFGEAASAVEYDENTIHSASELGLMEKGDVPKMLFFQLPANIPFGERPTSVDRTEAAGLLNEDSTSSAKDKAIAGSSASRGIVASAIAKGKEVPGHFSMGSASRKVKGIADSSTSSMWGNTSTKVCRLEELPAGCMGKMLVYKSGAVKLKLGDIIYDVSPGCDCAFAQEIMTVNTAEKQCCSLGELNKWAVVTPDIDSLLEL